MAITATFKADFTSFTTAVNQAEVELRGFEEGAGKVDSSLTKMANSLSGTKLIQDATLMAEAVERIGGVSMLTEKELQKVSAQASEAAAKLTAMGQDVPPGIQEIADQAKNVESTSQGLIGTLKTLAATFGIAFSVNALKDFAISVIQTGAHIGDLSQKLGVSTEAIQRWKYAAEQGGATIDHVDTAISTMNRTLSDGNTGTKAILEQIGLAFDDIRKLSPEDAFNAITDAVGEIEDPMLRAEAATRLFGRSGQELLPAIADGFQKVGKETKVMSEDTIRRLKEAEDAWGRLYNTVVIHSGGIIAETFRIGSSWKDMIIGLGVPSFLRDNVREALGGIYDTTESLTGALKKVPPAAMAMGASLKPVAIAGAEVEATIAKMNSSLHLTTEQLGLTEPKLGKLSDFMRTAAKENEVWNTYLRFTSEVIEELNPKIEKMAETVKKVEETQKAATSAFAQGSVQINTAGISIDNFAQKWEQFQRRFSQSRTGGSIGGGPSEDFLSWALRTGMTPQAPALAQGAMGGGGGGGSVNVNVNGVLMGDDPAAKAQLNQLINDSLAQSLRTSGMRI